MTVPNNVETLLENIGLRNKQLDCLTSIINKLLALQAAVDEADKTAQTLEIRPRCCGSTYIDPKGFTYANHGVSDVCPLHGQHAKAPGSKRLRLYIGNKQEAIEELRQAMVNWSEWHKAKRGVNEKKRELKKLLEPLESARQMANGHRWLY